MPLHGAAVGDVSVFWGIEKALEAAKKAASLNPDLARTQTVLGFAYLMEVKTTRRRRHSPKHRARPGRPAPKTRDGACNHQGRKPERGNKRTRGRHEPQPGNSLIRSYMGKAYFEEKKEKLAADEYKTAKELDSKDPTPYFYEAILKQTTNRPVEALHDIQTAMELNDNRAVYRSRLLLDADLAARSASLARIYSDLGFQQRALVEGWKSVNTDPSDFSGHRFLADTYAALPATRSPG